MLQKAGSFDMIKLDASPENHSADMLISRVKRLH